MATHELLLLLMSFNLMTLIFYYQPDEFINNDTLRIDVSADAVFSFPASFSFHGFGPRLGLPGRILLG